LNITGSQSSNNYESNSGSQFFETMQTSSSYTSDDTASRNDPVGDISSDANGNGGRGQPEALRSGRVMFSSQNTGPSSEADTSVVPSKDTSQAELFVDMEQSVEKNVVGNQGPIQYNEEPSMNMRMSYTTTSEEKNNETPQDETTGVTVHNLTQPAHDELIQTYYQNQETTISETNQPDTSMSVDFSYGNSTDVDQQNPNYKIIGTVDSAPNLSMNLEMSYGNETDDLNRPNSTSRRTAVNSDSNKGPTESLDMTYDAITRQQTQTGRSTPGLSPSPEAPANNSPLILDMTYDNTTSVESTNQNNQDRVGILSTSEPGEASTRPPDSLDMSYDQITEEQRLKTQNGNNRQSTGSTEPSLEMSYGHVVGLETQSKPPNGRSAMAGKRHFKSVNAQPMNLEMSFNQTNEEELMKNPNDTMSTNASSNSSTRQSVKPTALPQISLDMSYDQINVKMRQKGRTMLRKPEKLKNKEPTLEMSYEYQQTLKNNGDSGIPAGAARNASSGSPNGPSDPFMSLDMSYDSQTESRYVEDKQGQAQINVKKENPGAIIAQANSSKPSGDISFDMSFDTITDTKFIKDAQDEDKLKVNPRNPSMSLDLSYDNSTEIRHIKDGHKGTNTNITRNSTISGRSASATASVGRNTSDLAAKTESIAKMFRAIQVKGKNIGSTSTNGTAVVPTKQPSRMAKTTLKPLGRLMKTTNKKIEMTVSPTRQTTTTTVGTTITPKPLTTTTSKPKTKSTTTTTPTPTTFFPYAPVILKTRSPMKKHSILGRRMKLSQHQINSKEVRE
jgi:hypothetical protein